MPQVMKLQQMFNAEANQFSQSTLAGKHVCNIVMSRIVLLYTLVSCLRANIIVAAFDKVTLKALQTGPTVELFTTTMHWPSHALLIISVHNCTLMIRSRRILVYSGMGLGRHKY
jgi:hypothetical protein